MTSRFFDHGNDHRVKSAAVKKGNLKPKRPHSAKIHFAHTENTYFTILVSLQKKYCLLQFKAVNFIKVVTFSSLYYSLKDINIISDIDQWVA